VVANGNIVTVKLDVNPVASTFAQAIQESVSAGFTVSGLNEGGVFDANSSKIKWGPYFDNSARELDYVLTAPSNFTGAVAFSGVGSFDGIDIPVTGVDSIELEANSTDAPFSIDSSAFEVVTVGGGQFLALTVNGTPGRTYQAYVKNTLNDSEWIKSGPPQVAGSGPLTLFVTAPGAASVFLIVAEIRDLNPTDVDLISISDEEVPPDPSELYFLSPDLPETLPENTAFSLTLEVNDADGELLSIGGQFTLSLVLADDTPVPFQYTLEPSTLAAVNGVAQTTLTIHTANSLSEVFLAVDFFPSPSPIGLQGLGDRRRLAGPTGGAKKIASTRVSYDDFKDDTQDWGYPLPETYSLAGLYGEYPGHSAIHWGVDLTAPKGTKVLAAKRGVVIRVWYLGGTLGKYVAVYHGNGSVTCYLHVDPKVTQGTKVEKGDVLATVHDWGAPHLHFEMRTLSATDIAIANQKKGYKKFFGRKLKNLGSPVNPISSNYTFSSSLITDDSHFPSVQAIFLSADHPAETALSLPPSNPTPDLLSGDYPSEIFVVAQVVDYQKSSQGNTNVLNPKRIAFKPDANPSGAREIVYGNTENNILSLSPKLQGKGGTGGDFPGYVLLPPGETVGAAFRERRYKYWFDWDTSVYATLPGPHGFELEIEDIAGKTKSQVYSFGPKILHDGQPWLVPEGGTEAHVSVNSRTGPPPNPTGDVVLRDIGYATATVSPSSDWEVDFVDAGPGQANVERPGLASFSVTSDNQTTDLAISVRSKRAGVTSGVLTLKVNSAVFPNIHDEVTIKLTAQSSEEPVPIPAMVKIPAGTFVMGSPETEILRNIWDTPQHTVTISHDFYMSNFEVTRREYLAVMGNDPSYFTTKERTGQPIDPDLNRPVEQVSWNDAMSYCAKVTASEQAAGRLPAGWEYRLPTEAEWEYACRAGKSTAFHYGPDLRSGMANFYGYGEYVGGTGTVNNPNGMFLARTTAVGSYVPNAFGLYDMHGNVWEWCLDWVGSVGSYPLGSVNDPRGPSTGSYRVGRGGGYNSLARDCRSAMRDPFAPAYRNSNVGFRVVLASGQ
jgi:formylglycine-generating enzyme required for sulfatase activity/murein DD-endopeptidase MepM/ murein hydrolase activator NlpD